MMHAPTFPRTPAIREPPASGARLVSTGGRDLPLRGAVLLADAEGGLARVTLEQRFHNPHAEPLAVTYSLPLPADGAVSAFAFTVGGRRVVGEIDRREAARERFEEALVEGRSAALLEQDRSSLFTQEIGNVPPGEDLVVEVAIDQRLRWLDEGAWEWRFPTVVAPRYLGQPGRVEDAARVTQDVADGPLRARFALGCTIRDRLDERRLPESPSHPMEASVAEGALRIELADRAGAAFDRDVVVRWPVAAPAMGASLCAARPARGSAASRSGYGLLTVVPPAARGAVRAVPRDLVLLLDTSGSMGGEPLAQAVRVVSAIVDTLGDDDELEMLAFGSATQRWRPRPASATAATRREALAWLGALRASGGTEMRAAIVEALAGRRASAQRQVVLVTDGLIGFEAEVLRAICERLPPSSRLHTVGVGSAVNRSLTGPAARAGHGVEVVIGPGEDPERAAARLVARTDAPLLVDLDLSGSALLDHAPRSLPDLLAGAPALVSLALDPRGGALLVRGRTCEGTWEQRLRVPPLAEGSGSPAICALYGREAVEDLEVQRAAGGHARQVDAAIEQLGIEHQISTRLTSWIAVSAERTVRPGDPSRHERMPHELPHAMSAEGLGLRAPLPAPRAGRIEQPPKTGVEVWGGRPGAPLQPPRSDGPVLRRRTYDPRVPEPTGGGYGGGSGVRGGGGGGRPGNPGGSGGGVLRGRAGAIPVRGGGSARQAPPERVPPEKKAKEKPAPRPRRDDGPRILRGRVVLRRAGYLIVEITAEGAPLDWAPPAEARVAFADHRACAATVDERNSTRACTLAEGTIARLVLTLPPEAPAEAIVNLTLELGGDLVLVELG